MIVSALYYVGVIHRINNLGSGLKQRVDEHESHRDERKNESLAELRQTYQTTKEEAVKLDQLWEQNIKPSLKGTLSMGQFVNFGGSHLISLKGNKVVIALNNDFVKEKVEHQLSKKVERALLSNLDAQQLAIQFVTLR